MDLEQLRLLPPPRPFSNRLGPEFFKQLPKSPGVYLMRDQAQKIIYVGQSSNLKERLSSYKYLHPERTSRKIMRLMFRVEKVEVKLCSSPEEALLLENELLTRHNPTYNTANVYPKAYRFLHLEESDGTWRISLTPSVGQTGATYGAFKGGAYWFYASLIRLLWAFLHQPRSHEKFPCSLLSEKPAKRFELSSQPQAGHLWLALHKFLNGEEDQLVPALANGIPQPSDCRFTTHFLGQDLATVQNFFPAAQKNKQLREKFGLTTSWIPQEKLNELLLRNRRKKDNVEPAPKSTSESASEESKHPQTLPVLPSLQDRSPAPVEPGSRLPSSQLLFL